MPLRRRSRPVARRSGAAGPGGFVRDAILAAARLMLSVAGIALLAVAIVYARLLQGPILLPGAAQVLAERVNAASETIRLSAGDAVLTLGEGAATSGLQLRDVEVRSTDGQLLLAAPRLGARFRLSDLVHGRIQPVRVTLIEPDAQIIRTEDGRVRFGMGGGAGVRFGARRVDDQSADAVARIIDGFVGDKPPVPELARLERIEILGANLSYDDRRGGRDWATRNADLKLWRYETGVRATLEIGAGTRPTDPALRLVAERPAGEGRTGLRIRFDGIESGELARQARELEWAKLIGGRIEGEATLAVERDGTVTALRGRIAAADGELRGMGEPVPFRRAELRFRTDPARERLTIDSFRIDSGAVEADLIGYADVDRGPDGEMRGLAGQFEIGALNLDLPGVFAAPLAFDAGRMTARWSLPGQRIELREAQLASGAVSLLVDGQMRAGEGGWITDLRAEAEGITARDLVAYWPVGAARNARRWVEHHIIEGSVDRVVAQMRFGGIEPRVALHFDYSAVTADYVDGMSPILAAHGRGHLTYHDFFLEMDGGEVVPLPGQRVELAGSTAAIRGFWAKGNTAEISLKGTGPTRAVLALIDQEPLRLLRRLGRDMDGVAGTTQVEAELNIPLLQKLRLAEIGVDARAMLHDVALPFAISPSRSVDIAADRLELAANADRLHLSGQSLIEGAPVALDWREEYGAGPDGRTLALSGTANKALLGAVGAGVLPVSGAPEFDLALRQAGGGPLEFTLDADLAPARVEVTALDWEKPAGAPGRLRAEGVQGGGLDISAVQFEGPGLDAAGSLRLGPDGQLEHAHFARMRLDGRGSFAATLRPGSDGVLEVGLTGRELDLADSIDRQGDADGGRSGGASDPVRLVFELDRLRLSDSLALAPARGRIDRGVGGALAGRVEGRLGPDAPVAIDLDLPGDRPGAISMTSPNAGAALRAAGFYSGAEGGSLVLDATIGTGPERVLTGRAQIEDLTVRSQSTFRDVLTEGGLETAGQAVSGGGIGFRRVEVPFSYRGGVLSLDDAIASSPALALKLNGTVDERTDQVDLIGVLSPAYALTGALNQVPILGQILGGEGEGILAMTFRLRGPVEDPRFVVNPLSVLAPGFLRKIFSTPTSEVSEDFREAITRQGR